MSQFRRKLLMMMQNQKKYGLLKPTGTTSMFDFGVPWNQCNKIVLQASGVNSIDNNMLFTAGLAATPYIALNLSAFLVGNGCSISSYSGISEDITDGMYFDGTINFSAASEKTICNTWSASWSKQIIYHEIMFYNNDTLLADFVPDITNSDRMYDKVSGTYITASEPGIYQLVEV